MEEKKRYNYKKILLYYNAEEFDEVVEQARKKGFRKVSEYVKAIIFKDIRGW